MEKEGWVFHWDDVYAFSPGSKYCKGVPSTSYCGFKSPGDGMLSYTFSYFGIATLKYGQSFDTGSVRVKKNNIDINARNFRGSSDVKFTFTPSDVLQILEVGSSVMNIHKLTLEKIGAKTKSI